MTRSILLVDDDAGMVETLGDILNVRGYAVTTAESGEAAIASLNNRHFDLVLMDIKMPGVDGVSALHVVRRLAPATPVVMMTAFTRDELVAEARMAGAVEILPKPLDLDHVLTLVDRTIEEAGPGP